MRASKETVTVEIGNYGSAKTSYRGFEIVPKRDFGGTFHLIDGHATYQGFLMLYGEEHGWKKGCNAAPGAAWFSTVKEAKAGIDALIALGGVECKEWHEVLRKRREYIEKFDVDAAVAALGLTNTQGVS